MPTVMITGGNRGLGLEFVRQYLADGWSVIATCRDPATATELTGLAGDLTVHRMAVDMTRQIEETMDTVGDAPIDVLINNAGVYGPRDTGIGNLDPAAWRHVFEVNSIAPIKVAEAFLDNVTASEHRKIVSVSSKMGSIGELSEGREYIYRSSKAALNAAHTAMALQVAPRGIAAGVMHPGWVRTDMGGPDALIDVTESVTGMRRVIDNLNLENTARFWNYDGKELPW